MNDAQNRGLAGAVEGMVTRWVNPFGFGLALLLFLFVPSIAFSSELAGSEPLATLQGVLDVSSSGAEIAFLPRPHWAVTVRVLAIATLIVIAAGAATGAARTPQRRSLAATIAAALSGGLLIATALLGARWLEASHREFLTILSQDFSKPERSDLLSHVGDAVDLRIGFWLALAVLWAVAMLNILVLLREVYGRPTESSE